MSSGTPLIIAGGGGGCCVRNGPGGGGGGGGFSAGLAGGIGSAGAHGGFGGGGRAYENCCNYCSGGGGGGGFSGGSGGSAGSGIFTTSQGGGSFNGGSNPVNVGGFQTGNGLVQIEYVGRFYVVVNTNDSGAGSLRAAIAMANTNTTESLITFTNTLSGQTILLTSGELLLGKNMTIDGSSLPGGIAISGGGLSRVFNVASGSTVVLNSLTITNANGTSGGGIYNASLCNLTVNRCTLAGNVASSAGAIDSWGALTLNQCTLTGNSSIGFSGPGAIAVESGAVVKVNQSTITGNTAGPGSIGSGGILIGGGSLTISNSIVAGNSGTYSNLYVYSGTLAATGVNLTNGTPLLAALGNYGGPTRTMPPLSGSPAINGCTNGTSFTTDQRGLPRIVGTYADIGAVEGVFNPAGPGTLKNVTRLGNGSVQFGFTNVSGTTYTVLASTNVAAPLNTWLNLGPAVESPAGTYQFTDTQAPNYPRRFYV